MKRDKETRELELLWVGGEKGVEVNLISRTDIPLRTIPAAGVHGVELSALPGNLMRLFKGFMAARQIIQDFQPDVLFFTGGYVAVPMAFAGRLVARKRPAVLLYVPDIEPGLALQTLSRFADQIAVTAMPSQSYFSSRAPLVVTGYPTRDDLQRWDHQTAIQHFRLDDQLPVLFVFGGSTGARSINRALLAALPELLEHTQIIHVSGHTDWKDVQASYDLLAQSLRERYRVYPYLHEEMGAAFAAADLVLARAGASTLGEFPSFGLPAILVPYPYAWRYQKVNADYLVSRGAAVMIEDSVLPQRIIPEVLRLMNDSELRASMSKAMSDLDKPDAAQHIGELLWELSAARN